MQATLTPVNASRDSAARRNIAALPLATPDACRTAVLLNRNARRVNDRVARQLEQIVGLENVFYSRSLEEAEGFTREIVQQGYGTVVSGGGDGTLARTINLVHRYINEANTWRSERFRRYGERQSLIRAPRFGFLRLGTGNGMAHVLGAGHPVEDLRRIINDEAVRVQRLPLINVGNGELCFFAGLGYDSLILNDYNWLKARAHHPLMKRLVHSLAGYFAAFFARSLPSIVLHNAARIELRVVSKGRGYYIDPRRGDAVEEVAPNTTLFQGYAGMLGVATTPYYGYGFKVYPFASLMPGMMHLRIGNIGPGEALAHFPSVWKGAYRSPKRLFDFFVKDVEVELAQPYPFQHSGDAQGMRRNLRCAVAEEALEVLDMHSTQLPVA